MDDNEDNDIEEDEQHRDSPHAARNAALMLDDSSVGDGEYDLVDHEMDGELQHGDENRSVLREQDRFLPLGRELIFLQKFLSIASYKSLLNAENVFL